MITLDRWSARALVRPAALTALVVLVPTATSSALQDLDDYEYEADEGLHEQEWYDPSDWFDVEDGIDYESDWWDARTSDPYDPYDYDRYDRDDDRLRYGYHWEWDAIHDRWRRDYGYYDDSYALGSRYLTDPVVDYGPHWEWDPLELRWARDYGVHVNDYGIGYGAARDRERDRSADVDVSGTLESFRRIELEGQRDAHTLIRVRMQDGRSKVVNLGPRVEPAQLGMSSGDRVRLKGRMGSIDGRDVVLATKVSVEGDSTRIRAFRSKGSGDERPDMASKDRDTGSARQVLTGTLKDHEKVSSASNPDHVLVRLHMQDGRSRRVCIGPESTLDELGLEEGSQVRIEGFTDRVAGRDVFVATTVRVDDDMVSLQPASWKGGEEHELPRNDGRDGKHAVIRGRIEDVGRVQLDAARDEHTLIKLELQDGRCEIVDLGTRSTLDDFDMDEDDRIVVRGRRDRVNGKPIFRASQIRLDGEKHSIRDAMESDGADGDEGSAQESSSAEDAS